MNARLSGDVVSPDSADRTRKITFWTSCDASGTLVDTSINHPDSNVHSVEHDFAQQIKDDELPDLVEPKGKKIRDICSLTTETKPNEDIKERIKNIKGDASEYAVKVYSGSKNGGSPKW